MNAMVSSTLSSSRKRHRPWILTFLLLLTACTITNLSLYQPIDVGENGGHEASSSDATTQ